MEINGTKVNPYLEENVQEKYPSATMVAPMKMWTLPKKKEDLLTSYLTNPDYLWQEKKDGALYTIEITSTGQIFMFSRGESVKTKLLNEVSEYIPHLINSLRELPRGTILLGELYIPGGVCKDLNSIMRCLPAKAHQRIADAPQDMKPHFYIFDILQCEGEFLFKTPLVSRLELLDDIFYGGELDNNPCLEMAHSWIGSEESLELEALPRLANNKIEGLVGKLKKGIYYPDLRPAWETIKVKKKADNIDVICLGFTEPTEEYAGKNAENWPYVLEGKLVTKNKFLGWVGGLVVGAYDPFLEKYVKLGTVRSGLTDEDYANIKDNPEKYIYSPFSLECMETDAKAQTFRHARFSHWRDDISAIDCTLDKIFKEQ